MKMFVQGISIVALTGAGVSAESGVPTFRGPEGLWRTFRPEDLATPEAFARNPTLVWEWYDWRRRRIAACQPNPAHRVLAEMEATLPDFILITQNVDGLHQAAGSRKVLELHGNIWRVRCTRCGKVVEDRRVPLPEIPPHCACGGLLRPDVVWFGEPLPTDVLQQAWEAAKRCRCMLIIGTSALVQPAASLPVIAKQSGAYLVEVNVADTPLTSLADEVLRGPAGEVLPRWWEARRASLSGWRCQ
ncbi:MAG: NAD-dependent deacylase [Anaerolineae bacterium]|nr:NAD-dependent deacylase [Anaerolineae bacterium]MCX8067776.1 NAD-dependent deacylase [Anaerolineae bacterium]